jgi:hypothetical protein
MVDNLEGQIASAIARRKIRLDNSVPTATRFDPRLPTFRMPAPGSPRFSRIPDRSLPVDEADIAFASIGELAAWIGVGALTSRWLTEIYLTRIDSLGPRLECFATVTAKWALAEADAADALLHVGVNLGPLHGLPYGLKDLFDTKGVRRHFGRVCLTLGASPFLQRHHASAEQIDASAAIHGTLEGLEFVDLPFGLPVAPRL